VRDDAPLNNLHFDRLTLSQAIANFIHYLKEAIGRSEHTIAAYHSTCKKLKKLSPRGPQGVTSPRPHRVAILEWPYRPEENGPPLEHRLRPETVKDLATPADFQNVETIHLEHMGFYRLTP